MLRISKLADYGLMLISEMARTPQAIHNAKDLAAITHLAIPTVSKILKALTQASLLVSVRGAQGGYRLRHNPKDIPITHVISSIDGNFGLTECSQHKGQCSLEAYCSVTHNWQVINQAVKTTLDRISVADMAQPILPMPTLNVDKNKTIGDPHHD